MLIPKVKNPTKVTQFRPISLSNVVSRLASKVLAYRLKRLFPHIISENQRAFMSEHLITDNVLVTFEIMHHISQKKSGKVGEMVVKLDMSKAYDKVEWGCLEKNYDQNGRFVRSISYAIKINGKPRSHIVPSRDYAKRTPSLPIHSWFVQMFSLHSWGNQWRMA